MIVSLVCNERCMSTVRHLDDGSGRRKKLPKRLISQAEKKQKMIRARSRYWMSALRVQCLSDVAIMTAKVVTIFYKSILSNSCHLNKGRGDRSLIRRNLNSGLEFLVLCDSVTRVWSEILVDRVKHYVIYDKNREPRAFCASSRILLGQPRVIHSDLDSVFQVRQFLDSFEGDGELQSFLTSFSETAMFAEVVRAKASSMREKAPSNLPWDTQDYREDGNGRTRTRGLILRDPDDSHGGNSTFTYLNQLSRTAGTPFFSSVNLRVENP